MNYRHIYHAGNFADVFKHSIICLILEYLTAKNKPLTIIDSHAGIGLYDLTVDEALRSPEFQQGIMQILKSPIIPEMQTYVNIINQWQTEKLITIYPGSPLISQHFLREDDEMILNELHPDDIKQLKYNLKSYPNIHCHQRDAYEFLGAILPPKQRRGLVIIDPPFEQENEFNLLAESLQKSLIRFSTASYLIWYPLVSTQYEKEVKKIFNKINVPKLNASFTRCSLSEDKQGLCGNGVMIINPPWQIEQKVEAVAKYCQELFQIDSTASWQVKLIAS